MMVNEGNTTRKLVGWVDGGRREDCGGIMCFQIKSGVCIYQDMIVCVCVCLLECVFEYAIGIVCVLT